MSGSSKISDFFTNFRKKLEVDFCDDVDACDEESGLIERGEKVNDPIIDKRNKDSTIENPFLKDFFSRLKSNHKSKKFWFNQK